MLSQTLSVLLTCLLKLYLYFGLIIFCAYLLYDVQLLVGKGYRKFGEDDYIDDWDGVEEDTGYFENELNIVDFEHTITIEDIGVIKLGGLSVSQAKAKLKRVFRDGLDSRGRTAGKLRSRH